MTTDAHELNTYDKFTFDAVTDSQDFRQLANTIVLKCPFCNNQMTYTGSTSWTRHFAGASEPVGWLCYRCAHKGGLPVSWARDAVAEAQIQVGNRLFKQIVSQLSAGMHTWLVSCLFGNPVFAMPNGAMFDGIKYYADRRSSVSKFHCVVPATVMSEGQVESNRHVDVSELMRAATGKPVKSI